MTSRAMTPQEWEEWAKSFGKGLIVFGVQRPAASAQNSNSQPSDNPRTPVQMADSATWPAQR